MDKCFLALTFVVFTTKEVFPLSNIDMLVVPLLGTRCFSFINGFSGDN